MKRIKILGAIVALAVACALATTITRDAHAQIPNSSQVSSIFSCSADDVGATLTKFCNAPANPKLALYITTIVAQSTTTTSGNFILRYGTGSNCGTGTTSLLPSAATAARIAAPASTAAPTIIPLQTPLKVPAGNDLCVLGVATNTFTGQVTGYFDVN